MKYEALLLDIDNTLYSYDDAHRYAKDKVIEFCVANLGVLEDNIVHAYDKARKHIHFSLDNTAASHNRLLYFQKMLESLNINPLIYARTLENTYWDSFLMNIVPFDGVYELLEKYKYKICLVTDLTAHIQYRKIEKLNLMSYCHSIVTSEEVGREKPHPYMFELALQKLGLKAQDVCMIGDSWDKDVEGALNLGMRTIWLNHSGKKTNMKHPLLSEVSIFQEILELV